MAEPHRGPGLSPDDPRYGYQRTQEQQDHETARQEHNLEVALRVAARQPVRVVGLRSARPYPLRGDHVEAASFPGEAEKVLPTETQPAS